MSRLHALFLRYAAQHADRVGGFGLPRHKGRRLGNVERIVRVDGRTRIEGWTRAPSLRLSWPDGDVSVLPTIQRPDVAHRFGGALETGFAVEAPEGARPLTLHITLPTGRQESLPVPHPSDRPGRAARRRLLRAFMVDLMRAVPALWRWRKTGGAEARQEVKRIMGLEAVTEGLPIDRRYFQPGAAPRSRSKITIILPVYNARDLLPETLRRIAAHTDVDWHAILIDDASSDPEVLPLLRDWSAEQAGRATLIELPENLGFIGAVNRGFEAAERHGGHIVLLNSDAHVPAGWASRLIAPFDHDPTIASVTPMSNDAEIFSAPMICQAIALSEGLVDRLDAVAQTLTPPTRLPNVPTGVGFCMAISAPWFARVPRFDTAFGRGYGEEVDWCQKTRKAGARHVCLPSLFVEHRGGHSFGRAAKQALVLRANAAIARRYPRYDLEVQTFIGNDPLRTPRLALAVAMAGYLSRGALPLFLAHSLGGGADHALASEIAARTEQGLYTLVLRVGGRAPWQIEVHGPGGVVAVTTEDLDHVRRLLDPVPVLQIVYSCGVGAPDPVGLPGALMSLRRPGRGDTLAARIHDFFVVSPSYCLLDGGGAYRGPVMRDNPDAAHRLARADGSAVPLAQWQEAWHGFLSVCEDITVFSWDSRAQLVASYPDLADKVTCRPHKVRARVARVAPPPRGLAGGGALAVLGNLNQQKGAGVLCALGEKIAVTGGPPLVLIGNLDTTFSRPPSIRLHGSYAPDDIAHLAERYGVAVWLCPSIWPETFSFATHEMLATGLPVLGFDIGAQGEALRRAPNGVVLPFDPDADHAAVILRALDCLSSGVMPMGRSGADQIEEAAE